MTKPKDWIDLETPGRKPGSPNGRAFGRLCLRCRTLFWATRWDAVTCSVRCRVWIHRHPEVLDAAWQLSRGQYPNSRAAEHGYRLENVRVPVGQWLNYLAQRQGIDGVDPGLAFDMIARVAWGKDISRWPAIFRDAATSLSREASSTLD
jgi:hypothetical protein